MHQSNHPTHEDEWRIIDLRLAVHSELGWQVRSAELLQKQTFEEHSRNSGYVPGIHKS